MSFAPLRYDPLRPTNAGIASFPWHICSRASGSTITTKIWLDGEAEPGWNPATDPLHVQAVFDDLTVSTP